MTEYSENNFEQCIKCTVCTVYCPAAAANPLFPGPKQAGPDGERLRLKQPGFYDEALKYCLNCKRCEVACPSNVRIGDIIQLARIKYSKKRPGLREFVLANTDLVGTLSTPLAPIVNATVGLKPVKMVMDKVMRIDHRRTFPKYAFGTFEGWMRKQREAQAAFPEQVSYFHGCYVNYNNPPLGKDFVRVMNALGIGVQLLKKEKCCGVALISNGLINQAKRSASRSWNEVFPCWAPRRPAPSRCATSIPTCWASIRRTCAIAWSWRPAISTGCWNRARRSCASARMRPR